MSEKTNKISTRWIRETRTDFPVPERIGERGPEFRYPEWLIMFIAILSVKLKIKAYVRIHKMAIAYWDLIAEGMDLKPISERQIRERLKKSVISLESQQRLFFSYFLSLSKDRVVSADKMMNKAKGPVCAQETKGTRHYPKRPSRY